MVPIVLLAATLGIILSKGVAAQDAPFVQDLAFKSAFSATEAPVSTAWEALPFGFDEDSSFAKKGKIMTSGNAMYTISNGVMYCASLKNPLPTMESMESPYNAWTIVGDTGLSGSNIMVEALHSNDSSANSFAVYTLTADNIAHVTMGGGEGCGSVLSTDLLLTDESTVAWGDVTALEVAPSMKTVFIGSSNEGAFAIDMSSESKTPEHIHGDKLGGGVATLKWVEQWKTLFVSNPVALFTLNYEEMNGKYILAGDSHEWIGGVLATTVTDMDFDATNDFLWLAESEALHKLNKGGMYFRYGWQQGAPMYNISSVSIIDGQVYAGSDTGLGMSRVSTSASPMQLDASISTDGTFKSNADPSGDPWAWSYFFGPRYLPSNTILSIIPDLRPNAGHSVLVATDAGFTYLRAEQMTLTVKAAAMQTFQKPRHDRHGLISPVNLQEFGVLDSYQYSTNDNDGLWTGMSIMGLSYRYAHSLKDGGKGDEEARALAWNAFEAMEHLSTITGGYPHFVARSMCKVSDGDAGCPTPDPDCVNDCWYYAPNREGWYYKGDTSSDELTGHFAAYALVHDFIATTQDEKDRVLRLMDGILMGIIDNDLYLIQPATGKRTLWGFWNPKEVNYEPEHYSERGTNSLEILAWLTQQYSITGNMKYKEQFEVLVKDHKYVENTYNVKIDSLIDENHSDTELIMLAFHSLFYADQRLDDDHPRKKEVQAMVKPLIPSLKKTFMLMKGELSPLWLGIYAGTAQQSDMIKDSDLSDATWSLRKWALDLISWEIQGTQRIDLDFNEHFQARMQAEGHPLMRHIRPPAERAAGEWNADPFDTDPGGSGMSEYEPGTWLLPYYIMLYNGLIQ